MASPLDSSRLNTYLTLKTCMIIINIRNVDGISCVLLQSNVLIIELTKGDTKSWNKRPNSGVGEEKTFTLPFLSYGGGPVERPHFLRFSRNTYTQRRVYIRSCKVTTTAIGDTWRRLYDVRVSSTYTTHHSSQKCKKYIITLYMKWDNSLSRYQIPLLMSLL